MATTPLWGDVATPRPQWTTVRMVSEQANITLGHQKVQVDATFEMHNLGGAATVAMGYPSESSRRRSTSSPSPSTASRSKPSEPSQAERGP